MSILKAAEQTDLEIFVVDNASNDGSIEYLQPKFPSVNFTSNTVNRGFAKANNQVLSACSGKYVLYLNPDTIVPPDCFRKCVDFLEVHPDAGALGVKMYDGNNEFLKESKRGLPSPVTSLWKLTGIIKLFPRSKYFARYYMGHLDDNTTHEVEVLSGAFMMVRKKILDETGGFDERFFMYAEDIDLSLQILKKGYKNYYFPETSIIHYKGASTKKDFKYVKQFYLAMSQFVKKHYGRGAFSLLLDTGIFLRGGAEAFRQILKKKK